MTRVMKSISAIARGISRPSRVVAAVSDGAPVAVITSESIARSVPVLSWPMLAKVVRGTQHLMRLRAVARATALVQTAVSPIGQRLARSVPMIAADV